MYHLPTFGQQAISPCLQEGTFTWRPTTPTKTLPCSFHLLLPYKPKEPQNCGFCLSKVICSSFPRLQSLLESRGWWGLELEPWMPWIRRVPQLWSGLENSLPRHRCPCLSSNVPPLLCLAPKPSVSVWYTRLRSLNPPLLHTGESPISTSSQRVETNGLNVEQILNTAELGSLAYKAGG